MNVVLNAEVCFDTSWPENGKINYIYWEKSSREGIIERKNK